MLTLLPFVFVSLGLLAGKVTITIDPNNPCFHGIFKKMKMAKRLIFNYIIENYFLSVFMQA
jgi:hypothetical protein